MQTTFKGANGKLKLTDNASRVLLEVSFVHQLKGDFVKGDFIQKNVAENVGTMFDLDKELFLAKSRAVNYIKKENQKAETVDNGIIEPIIVKVE